MKKSIRVMLAGAVVAVFAPLAQAQESHSGDAASTLPEVCRSQTHTPPSTHSEADTAAMKDHQKAAAEAMMTMDRDMAQGMMKDDPDVAFVCGMIAHHQGAIDMASVELQYGDDAWAKEMAQKVIEAQTREIADMTDWLKDSAR